ncbi:Npun_F0813 family protein [Sodalinema gerasimenkoae]|uniref:Npun_F0813 family protein n=1 Tax=Sodalinema gerasimenkoae TaxID=2862348 RepID=UPI001356840A|nr:Npun_F0813 family protein [Sodalinema gerasimenkoae]
MFILKRQDVEITSVQHPKSGQSVPVLKYQGQTFRLISVFNANQAEEARSFWRDLTDNRGKACVLLEEPDRYSVWGKVRLEQISGDSGGDEVSVAASTAFTQASLLLLQAVYFDVEDLLGTRQASAFEKEISKVFQQWNFPQAIAPNEVEDLLQQDPLEGGKVPPWQEHHLNTLLQELYRIGKDYFGNSNFAGRAVDSLEDLPDGDRTQFINWMNQSPLGKLWTTA